MKTQTRKINVVLSNNRVKAQETESMLNTEYRSRLILKGMFEQVRHDLFQGWDHARRWRVRLGRRAVGINEDGHCDTERRLIYITPRFEGEHLLTVIAHEICHAYSPCHGKVFVKRLRKAAQAAKSLGRETLARSLEEEATTYENTPKVRARDVYSDIRNAAIEGLSERQAERAVASSYGLMLKEFRSRYPRARRAWKDGRELAATARAPWPE